MHSKLRRFRRTGTASVLGLAAVLVLAACTSAPPEATPETTTPGTGTGTSTVAPGAGQVEPDDFPVVIASGLESPWSILRLPDGATLVSERDTALVRELLPDGSLREAGAVASARPDGEGGLLGLAFLAGTTEPGWVYAYVTTATDNRIERMPLLGAPGSHTLGEPEPVLTGIPRAGNHDGGRLGFGPDGLLYATAGDAGNTANAQDPGSLGGKILRMTPTGDVPAGNPFDTLVYSLGHRNPQGIAWDSQGRLWASEFGQNTWDELNLIEAGANYGWPEVEGRAENPDFTDPVQQWSTDEASPSGIAIVNDTLFMAGLRGARLWSVNVSSDGSSPSPREDWFVNSFGRLRDVVSGPGGTLWFVSSNTDGRGSPAADDDRLYQVDLQEGEASNG